MHGLEPRRGTGQLNAKQRLIGIAAELAQGSPLLSFELLLEDTGHAASGRALLKALNAANDRLRVLAIELRDAINELNIK